MLLKGNSLRKSSLEVIDRLAVGTEVQETNALIGLASEA
jgi:hypothetical protein